LSIGLIIIYQKLINSYFISKHEKSKVFLRLNVNIFDFNFLKRVISYEISAYF